MRIVRQKGFSVLEIIIAIFIFLIIFLGFSYLLLDSLNFSVDNQNRLKAQFLAQEGLEVVTAISQNDWSQLAEGDYGLQLTDSKWQLSKQTENLSSQLKSGKRLINIENVNDYFKKITSTVTWQNILQHNKQTFLITYLADKNRQMPGDWEEPVPVGYYQLLADARSVFNIGNRTYIGTLNFKGSPDFYIFDTSDPANPILIQTLDLGANTWATVNSIYVVGDYAYLATTINGREFVVVDISDEQNPQDIGYYSTQTLVNATGVHVVGDYAYLTNLYKKNQKQLYAIDISQPTDPEFTARIELDDSAYNLTYLDHYVLVASGKDDQEIQIIDMSDPYNPQIRQTIDLSGNHDAYDIFVQNNLAYVVRQSDPVEYEFYIIDLNNIDQPEVISALDLSDTFRTVYSNGQYILVGGDLDQSQLRLIDVSDIYNPFIVTSLDIKGIVYDLVATPEAAYLAVGGGEESENGLKIIIPGY